MGNTFSNMGHLNAVTELEKEMDSNTAPIRTAPTRADRVSDAFTSLR